MRNMPALHQRFGDSNSFWPQRLLLHHRPLIIERVCVYIYVGSLDRPAVFLYLSPMQVGFVVSEGPFYRIFSVIKGTCAYQQSEFDLASEYFLRHKLYDSVQIRMRKYIQACFYCLRWAFNFSRPSIL
jgi:hypothetical protein